MWGQQQRRQRQLARLLRLLVLVLVLGAQPACCGEKDFCCPQGRCRQESKHDYDVCDNDDCYSKCKDKDQCWSPLKCPKSKECLAKGPTTWCQGDSEKAICEKKSPVEHATECPEGVEHTKCTPKCAEGFTRPTGATGKLPQYICSSLGTWDPALQEQELKCVKQCPALQATDHMNGHMNTSGCKTAPMDSTCPVWCEAGFVNTAQGGDQQGVTYVCTADGTWRVQSGSLDCREVICNATAPTNHSQPCNAGGGYVGEECQVYCLPGYTIHGPDSGKDALDFTCSPHGRWLPDVSDPDRRPTCQKLQGNGSCCPNQQCNPAQVSTNCTTKTGCLSAADGCGGFWCVDGVPTNCPAGGPDVRHASGCNSSDQASQCMMKCDAGFVPAHPDHSGGVNYVCSSGQWKQTASGETLACHAGCSALPHVANAQNNCTNAYDGSRCTAQCDADYVNTKDADEPKEGPFSMANETLQYVCNDGQWQALNSTVNADEPQKMNCQPTVCAAVAPKSNAESCEGEAAGEKCVVACIGGFNNTVNASSNPALRFTCRYDGVWVQSGGDANCVDCAKHREQCYRDDSGSPSPPPPAPGGDDVSLWPKIVGGCLATAVAAVAVSCCCSSRGEKDRAESVLRESILGSEAMPDVVLAARDVQPRWVATNIVDQQQQQQQQQQRRGSSDRGGSGSGSGSGGSSRSSVTRTGSGTVFVSGKRRMLKGKSGVDLPVMFTNDTMGELQPKHWRHHPLGKKY
eukprot:SAG25_NODE_25_length_21717_cov_29.421778_11_plen_743_part_00